MLEQGMVLNVEPMVVVSGVTLKIEDAILVTDTGYRLLNKAEYGLIG
jgi:Xaa-Pro aminopeptidase